jgi:hypothetical protein
MSAINGLGRLGESLPASIGKAAESLPKAPPKLPPRNMGALGGLQSEAGTGSTPKSSALNRIGSAQLPSLGGATARSLGTSGLNAFSGADKSSNASKIDGTPPDATSVRSVLSNLASSVLPSVASVAGTAASLAGTAASVAGTAVNTAAEGIGADINVAAVNATAAQTDRLTNAATQASVQTSFTQAIAEMFKNFASFIKSLFQ